MIAVEKAKDHSSANAVKFSRYRGNRFLWGSGESGGL